eukprot:6301669-Amphidinium_carterae.1
MTTDVEIHTLPRRKTDGVTLSTEPAGWESVVLLAPKTQTHARRQRDTDRETQRGRDRHKHAHTHRHTDTTHVRAASCVSVTHTALARTNIGSSEPSRTNPL